MGTGVGRLIGGVALAAGLTAASAVPAVAAGATPEPRIVLVSTLTPKLPTVEQARLTSGGGWISADGRQIAYNGSHSVHGARPYRTDLTDGTTQPLPFAPDVPYGRSVDGDLRLMAGTVWIPDPRPAVLGTPQEFSAQVTVWNVRTGTPVAVAPEPPCPADCVWNIGVPKISDDGRVVVFWGEWDRWEGDEYLWGESLFAFDIQANTLEPIAPGVDLDPYEPFDLSADGRYVVTVSDRESEVVLIDRATGQVTQFGGHRSTLGPSIAGNGETIVYVAFFNGTSAVRAIDVASGTSVDLVSGDHLHGVEISRTGRFVAYTSLDGPWGQGARLSVLDRNRGSTWSADEQSTVPDPDGLADGAGGLRFSRNERYLAFATDRSNIVPGIEAPESCTSLEPPQQTCSYAPYLYRARLY